MHKILGLILCLVLAACSPSNGLSPGEGYVAVDGGKVWYRIVGSGDATPVILMHGGPGASSGYLMELERLAVDRPVIFYDQLGSGKSDRPEDQSLWTNERFVKELGQLREALKLEEVHLYGHSWGAMLAIEYMRTNPEGVESLVMASPVPSASRWEADAERLILGLPQEMQDAISRHEAAGTTDSEEYQAAMMEFYRRHISVSDPWPDYLVEAFEDLNGDVYGYMWGPSEFSATGTLKTFEREDYLPHIKVPILWTAGRFDEATPESLEHYHSLTPGSEIAIMEHSAHMTMVDEPEAYAEVVGDFLKRVDGAD